MIGYTDRLNLTHTCAQRLAHDIDAFLCLLNLLIGAKLDPTAVWALLRDFNLIKS